MSIRPACLAALALLVLACASESNDRRRESARRVPPPPSALVALVRSLEVLDGLQESDTWVHVRAVEADALIDRQENEEYVRLVLDLTVLARDLDRAHATFGRIERALWAEARSSERTPDVDPDRVERTFRDLDWSAEPPTGGPVFAELVSVSSSVRVEVRSGRARVQLDEGVDGGAESAASVPLKQYLEEVSARADVGLAPLEVEPFLTRPWPHLADMHARVVPATPGASFDRFQIGNFLQALEGGSPLLRVTRIDIHLADVEPERWTFAAEVVVREPAGSAS
jgi:hypothetical protein